MQDGDNRTPNHIVALLGDPAGGLIRSERCVATLATDAPLHILHNTTVLHPCLVFNISFEFDQLSPITSVCRGFHRTFLFS